MRRSIVLVLLATVALSAGPAHARGSFKKYTYQNSAGSRVYWLYSPAKKSRALIVFLHGCIQTALQAATSTRFNALADRYGFVVAYPQQNVTSVQTAPLVDGNGLGCWNWFLRDDQVRDKGEPALIAGITRAIVSKLKIDPNRVYLDGVSAGADMAVNVAASYPDLYAAAGAIAGCAYATCSDLTGALTYRAMGLHARVMPLFVENGTADTLNPVLQSAGLIHSWLGAMDMADGSVDGSVPRTAASMASFETNQTPSPGSGDICIRNYNYPCPGGVVGFKGSYPYTIQKYADARGCDVLDFWIIHGLEHAYPDSPSSTVYSDPLGPDISTATIQFFLSHPMRGGACVKPA